MKGISMFSSGGIAETYINDTKVDILLANEIIEERAEFYKYSHRKTKMICGDICSKKVFDEYITNAKKINPSFLLATPPCQGMSSLGKKNYKYDGRNFLVFKVIDVIQNLNLDYILIENVTKFFKLIFPFDGGFLPIIDILKLIFSNNYTIEHNILNAKDYGVPQSRPRAIIKMYKKNKKWGWPNKLDEITLREAIGHLPTLFPGEKSEIPYHYAVSHNDRQIKAMMHTPEGHSAMKNPIHFPKKINGDKVKGFHNTYKRMKWDSPCPARATNNGLISGHNNVHPGNLLKDGTWSDPRVLTLLETFIVSSLPTNWDFPSEAKESLIRLLIGEAIPPLLLKKIILEIN